MSIDTDKNTNKPQKKAVTSKQIVAMAGVILLALLYVITLIVAIADNSASGRLIWMCLFATIAIPMLIWIYAWIYGKLTGKPTLSDSHPNEKDGSSSDN